MDKKQTTYLLIGVLIGGICTWLLTANSIIPPVWQDTNSTLEINGGNGKTAQNIDAHFIEQMIPHHEDAILMARLAQTKATRPEVKNLADSIIKSQTVENNLMRDWYKQWFGRDLPAGYEVMNSHSMMSGSGMHMGMMGDSSDLERLENASDFDREFVTLMIPHHQMAVMMTSMLKGGTQRPEMKKLADDIIKAQSDEISQMRSWLKEWIQ